jgi:hypothetical protein
MKPSRGFGGTTSTSSEILDSGRHAKRMIWIMAIRCVCCCDVRGCYHCGVCRVHTWDTYVFICDIFDAATSNDYGLGRGLSGNS